MKKVGIMSMQRIATYGSFLQAFDTVILYKGLWKNYPIWFLMTLFVCKLLVVVFGKKRCYGIALVCAGCCILNLNEMLPAFWLFTTISAMPFLCLE